MHALILLCTIVVSEGYGINVLRREFIQKIESANLAQLSLAG
jgi:hypothetical protein